jgi:protein-disulfide isomerase
MERRRQKPKSKNMLMILAQSCSGVLKLISVTIQNALQIVEERKTHFMIRFYRVPSEPSGFARKLKTVRFASVVQVCLLCLLVIFSGACAQQSSNEEVTQLRKEIAGLKEEQQRLLEQIRELKAGELPKSISPAKPKVPFDMAVNANTQEVKGNKGARIAIIEFSDFQCSYCLSYVTQTFPQIDKDYIKTGKVKYFFRNLPLTDAHPNAFRAAEAAHCAAEQGKFWEAHDRFFANQNTLNPNDWPQHAQALGLNKEKFNQCLDSGKYDDEINQDIDDAQRVGIIGTPAFLIGVIAPNSSKVTVSKIMMGAESYDSFKKALDETLFAK